MTSRTAWTLLATMALLPTPSPAVEREDDRLDAYFREYLDAWFADEPLSATRLGDHRFDDRLDDLSPEARAGWVGRDRAFLDDLPRRVDYDALSRDGQVDYEIFRHHLDSALWLAEHFDPFVEDPRVYVGYTTEGVYLLLTQSTLPKATNLANAIARIGQVPRVVETAKATLSAGETPRVKVETAILQTRGAIGFYTDEVFLLADRPRGEGELAEAAGAAVEALRGYLEFLEGELLPEAGEGWRIGPELFAEKVGRELDSGLTAAEILDEARAEAEQVEAEMAVLSRQIWSGLFPGEVIPPDDERGRRAMIRRVLGRIGEEHGTPEGLVEDATATVDAIKAFIAERGVLELPEPDRCAIIEMPEFMRGNSVAYLNPAPPLDPGGGSEYAISPPPGDWDEGRVDSFLREYNARMLRILTIHEAYPGHYVQLEYANRCPSLIRKVLSSGTFAEGWAVYTERMMLDEGFGEGDPKLRLQQLKFYLRAVVNAILDHEMHAGDMTDDEALDLLMDRAFQTEGEAVGKVIRSKQSSAQLSTYFVGRVAFHRLRRDIQLEQGDEFDLGRYHEAALSHGTLPVKYLPELVRRSLGMEAAGD
ncbi:DUF885 domain-containing protein [Tautonia plasticadhaerens]|uniref:DUF885 domain-containing protein n=1 Tax=Tautonia plasticadhaerens TaxID=2527974 RepID=A0A518GWH3_9BACT|nr:DUF885 domain-containing protein [Tautonia plasticadhaerens]QDV32945.1 hypothetical protein ElP_07870 [Tautonia plasticadhaerens]